MTEKTREIDSTQAPGFATAAGPKQLLAQLASMLDQNPGGANSLEERLSRLESSITDLGSRLADGAEGAARAGGGFTDDALGEKLKKLISSVLIESGFLEKFVKSTVEKRLGDAGAPDAQSIRQQAAQLAKEFLSENLGAIFQKEIQEIVRKEVSQFLAGDEMKMLLDDKFRAVTLFLKTDVIPNAVRHALKSGPAPRA